MMVNIQQIQIGVTKYIENELASKATGFTKFALYFMLPTISSKVVNLINQYKNNDLVKEFFDENGNVNLDELYNNAKSAIAKSGQFMFYGIIFNETDIDKLYESIRTVQA